MASINARLRFSNLPGCDPAESVRFDRGRYILRWAALIYTFYFFYTPYYRHSARMWMAFAVFYATFLTFYFLVLILRGRVQYITCALFFVLGFVYYPFDRNSIGTFVYAFVTLAFFVHRLSVLFAVLAAIVSGVFFETWMLGFPIENAESVLFLCVVIGLSNFAYSQQARANRLLEKANTEIKRLSEEAERERIARDLHDLLGHTLTLITVKLDLARRLLPGDPDHARSEIVEAEQTARKALAEVREAVVGYRSEGLSTEIAQARRTLTAAGVQLTTAIAPVELSPQQVNGLCLALREAATNIVRHAQATTCHVELAASDSQVTFTIEDNGSGGPVRMGNGLRGMSERARDLSGTLEISTTTTNGTRLILRLPAIQDARLPSETLRMVEQI